MDTRYMLGISDFSEIPAENKKTNIGDVDYLHKLLYVIVTNDCSVDGGLWERENFCNSQDCEYGFDEWGKLESVVIPFKLLRGRAHLHHIVISQVIFDLRQSGIIVKVEKRVLGDGHSDICFVLSLHKP